MTLHDDAPNAGHSPNRRRRFLKRWLRRLLFAAVAMLLAGWTGWHVLDYAFPFPAEKLKAAGKMRPATLVLDRNGDPLRAFTGEDDQWLFWQPIEAISPHLIRATIAAEDKRFRSHGGVDTLALSRAVWSNLAARRVVSGASTISMQTIRLLTPRPRRLASKMVEAFRATQLERLLTKDEILEYYLNLAPYGGNILGAEAASQFYFRKSARDLTLAEAALLAGLPQSPSRLRPDRHPQPARERRDYVLEQMQLAGMINKAKRQRAAARPVAVRRSPLPFDAPHFTRLVRQRYPESGTLKTTLDPQIQQTCRTALLDAVGELRPAGVTNGSVVVIENETGSVRAMIGSCDFFSEADSGQVNGAIAARSPGSALKPFTYALAFDRGICTPATVLPDVPVNYGGYRPENYDHHCRGPASARQALSLSLNIPAVRLLEDLGRRNLHSFLKDLGISTLTHNADYYGLGLTLGSAEVTLLELTNAYAALARLGIAKPYRLLESEPAATGERTLSPESAWLTADVLAATDRLNGASLWKSKRGQVKIAWKTGTSSGHRDCWTIAYTPHYTVGVWLGNFSGKSSKALVGIDAAAPVAARIIDQITAPQQRTDWFARPAGVDRIEVCTVSGMPAGPYCPDRRSAFAIRGKLRRPCSVHRQVEVDPSTGRITCPSCAADSDRTVIVEAWPVELAAWLRVHQPDRPIAPPQCDCCTQATHTARPRIVSPASGQTFILTSAANQKLALKAASTSEEIYWFIDGTLLTRTSPSAANFWPLQPGTHTVTCSDSAGRSTSVTIDVQCYKEKN